MIERLKLLIYKEEACHTGGGILENKCISFRTCEKTEEILKKVPAGEKSLYIRRAIIFYEEFGGILNRLEKKIDSLGEKMLAGKIESNNSDEVHKNSVTSEDYLFSGLEEIF